MAKTLVIDLASHDGCIACCDGELRAFVAADHRIADHELLPLVEGALKESGWSMGDLERIACVVGPGGFTSLRVAVTLANTLAAELHIPLAGMHGSDLWKARCSAPDVLWFHSTKKAELFIRGFGAHAARWSEPTLLNLTEAATTLPEHAQWCGELLPEHEKTVSNGRLERCACSTKESILPSMVESLLYSSQRLEPWYGRGW